MKVGLHLHRDTMRLWQNQNTATQQGDKARLDGPCRAHTSCSLKHNFVEKFSIEQPKPCENSRHMMYYGSEALQSCSLQGPAKRAAMLHVL